MQSTTHVYEVRPRKDKRRVDLLSDALLFGRLWYGEPDAISNAIGYAQHYSRSYNAVIRVYDAAGNVMETHEHKSDFKKWSSARQVPSRWLSAYSSAIIQVPIVSTAAKCVSFVLDLNPRFFLRSI